MHVHFFNPWFLAAVAVSLLNVAAGLVFVFEEMCIDELLIGWFISFIHHITGYAMTYWGRLIKTSDYFIQCMGFNGLRAGIFFAAAICVLYFTDVKSAPFVYALFGTYFIFLVHNVLHLQFLFKPA